MPVNQQKSYTLKLVLLGKSVTVKILEQMLIHFLFIRWFLSWEIKVFLGFYFYKNGIVLTHNFIIKA